MTGLDTNVLVRYIMQDEPRQAAAATRLIESLDAAEAGFVPLVVVIELAWVLAGAYDLDRGQLCAALAALLRTKELVVERADAVWKAVRRFESSTGDFADCLIERSAAMAGCDRTMTFDRDAAKHCGMTLVH